MNPKTSKYTFAEYDHLRALLAEADELAADHPEQARDLLLRVQFEAALKGIESPSLHFFLAVAHHRHSDQRAALNHMTTAVRLDPLSEQLQENFEVLVSRIRRALRRATDLQAACDLHELLAEHGVVDDLDNVAFAESMIHAGQLEQARPLLEAVLKRDQNCLRALAALQWWSVKSKDRALYDLTVQRITEVQQRPLYPVPQGEA